MYKERIIENRIKELLQIVGAIEIVGPKWCGKTTTCKQFSQSMIDLQDPTNLENYKNIASNNIMLLLEGEKPKLIDEWQEIKYIWNAVRKYIDYSGKLGQFLLTGSTIPPDHESLHTGTGRIATIVMKTMSLFESGDSNGSVSLKQIINNENIIGKKSDITYERLAQIVCRGGFPSTLNLKIEAAIKVPEVYLNSLCNYDISSYDGVKRDSKLALTILKAYSRHISTIDSDSSFYNDVRNSYGDVTNQTIINYVNILKKLYIIDEIEAWNPNIRSKTSILVSPKKTLVDPSLACAALLCSPKDLMFDTSTFGLLFENLCDRDLSIYASYYGGYLRHYRDRFGIECDTILTFPNGEYGLVQIKMGSNKIKEAIDTMKKIKEMISDKLIDNNNLKLPSFMMVITNTEIPYKDKDGVYIVPIGCLKP